MGKSSSVGAGRQELCGLSSDRQFLVGGYHGDRDQSAVRRDHPRDLGAYVVELRFHLEPEAIKTLDHCSPHCRTVLTDTGGEAEYIEPTEEREVRADIVLEPMDIYLERELRPFVTGGPALLQFAEVVDAGHSLEPGLLVQQGVDVADGHPELVV